LIGTIVKVSLPSAAVYYTVKEGFWLPGAGSAESEKRLQEQTKKVANLRSEINHQVKPVMEPLTGQIKPTLDSLKIPNLSCAAGWWNFAVKTTIRNIADFDAKATIAKVSKMVNQPSSDVPSESKKTQS